MRQKDDWFVNDLELWKQFTGDTAFEDRFYIIFVAFLSCKNIEERVFRFWSSSKKLQFRKIVIIIMEDGSDSEKIGRKH